MSIDYHRFTSLARQQQQLEYLADIREGDLRRSRLNDAFNNLDNCSPNAQAAMQIHSKVKADEGSDIPLRKLSCSLTQRGRIGENRVPRPRRDSSFSMKGVSKWIGSKVSGRSSSFASFSGATAKALKGQTVYPETDSRCKGLLQESSDTEHHAVMDLEMAHNLGASFEYMSAVADDRALFERTPCLGDIKQADSLDDCYLLSGVASILVQEGGPQAIQKIMRENDDGTVTVRLRTAWLGAETSYVDITVSKDQIYDDAGKAMFSSKAVWVRCLEKAFYCRSLLVHGQHFNYSDPHEAYAALKGVSDSLNTGPKESGDFSDGPEGIREALEKKQPVTISTKASKWAGIRMSTTGLISNHNYAILAAGPDSQQPGAERGFYLFDPYPGVVSAEDTDTDTVQVNTTRSQSAVIFITEAEYQQFFKQEFYTPNRLIQEGTAMPADDADNFLVASLDGEHEIKTQIHAPEERHRVSPISTGADESQKPGDVSPRGGDDSLKNVDELPNKADLTHVSWFDSSSDCVVVGGQVDLVATDDAFLGLYNPEKAHRCDDEGLMPSANQVAWMSSHCPYSYKPNISEGEVEQALLTYLENPTKENEIDLVSALFSKMHDMQQADGVEADPEKYVPLFVSFIKNALSISDYTTYKCKKGSLKIKGLADRFNPQLNQELSRSLTEAEEMGISSDAAVSRYKLFAKIFDYTHEAIEKLEVDEEENLWSGVDEAHFLKDKKERDNYVTDLTSDDTEQSPTVTREESETDESSERDTHHSQPTGYAWNPSGILIPQKKIAAVKLVEPKLVAPNDVFYHVYMPERAQYFNEDGIMPSRLQAAWVAKNWRVPYEPKLDNEAVISAVCNFLENPHDSQFGDQLASKLYSLILNIQIANYKDEAKHGGDPEEYMPEIKAFFQNNLPDIQSLKDADKLLAIEILQEKYFDVYWRFLQAPSKMEAVGINFKAFTQHYNLVVKALGMLYTAIAEA